MPNLLCAIAYGAALAAWLAFAWIGLRRIRPADVEEDARRKGADGRISGDW